MSEYLDVLRTEKKYLLPTALAGQIQARLSHIMQADAYCQDNQPYLVRSLYFDSLENRDYREKCSGLENRKKIRLRTYSCQGPAKLEWKQKQGQKQRKRSLPVTLETAETLSQGEYSVLLSQDSPLAREFYATMTEQVYLPRCLVEYNRFAFVEPTNDIRITFDRDISSSEGNFSLFGEKTHVYPVQSPEITVLEIKYNHFLLDHIQTALAPFGLMESSSSKYVRARHFGLGVSLL